MTIYLVFEETKNRVTLEAFHEALLDRGLDVVALDIVDDIIENNANVLRRFALDDCAVVVYASAFMRRRLEFFRATDCTVFIGVEHGIAPFKTYTYGEHLFNSDFYIAPTKMWHDRLAKLYPQHIGRLRFGGYPRIHALRSLMSHSIPDVPVLKRWLKSERRDLVIFSWGVDINQLRLLPDSESILYVFHPADSVAQAWTGFNRSTTVSSTPEIVACALSSAQRIFGDFSSLSLEAISLGLDVYLFIDRRLYLSDGDIAPSFFNRDHEEFALVPKTDVYIGRSEILDANDLKDALSFGRAPKPPWKPDAELLCDAQNDDAALTASIIYDIARCQTSLLGGNRSDPDTSLIERRILYSRCVADIYRDILGRRPDIDGLLVYIEFMENQQGHVASRALKVAQHLIDSPEALERFSGEEWARLCFSRV